MPIPLLPAIQVQVRGLYFGQLVENVWYCSTTLTTPTAESLTTIAGIFQTAYASIQLPLSQDYSVNEIYLRYLGDAAGPETTYFVSPAQTGGNASPGLPGNVAFCVRLKTTSPGRSGRGRKYFCGLTEADVTANQLSVDVANDLVDAIGILISNLDGAGFPLAIASFTTSTVSIVTQAGYFDLNLDSQRRRLPGRGR